MGTNYYVRTPACENACEHCSKSQQLHLGKTSAGWRFAFQAQPEWPRNQGFTHWKTLASTGPIEDEYGQPVTLDDLLAMIDGRRDLRSHLAPQPDIGIWRASDDWFESDGHEFGTRDFT